MALSVSGSLPRRISGLFPLALHCRQPFDDFGLHLDAPCHTYWTFTGLLQIGDSKLNSDPISLQPHGFVREMSSSQSCYIIHAELLQQYRLLSWICRPVPENLGDVSSIFLGSLIRLEARTTTASLMLDIYPRRASAFPGAIAALRAESLFDSRCSRGHSIVSDQKSRMKYPQRWPLPIDTLCCWHPIASFAAEA